MSDESLRELQATRTSTDLKQRLRLLCLSKGSCGILSMGRMFRRMNEEEHRELYYDEFLEGLKETGMEISEDEAQELFEEFDVHNSGKINMEDFLAAIRVSK